MSIYAMDHGARHHGFGCSTTELMTDIPMFSSDSTSWLAGEQYGQVIQPEKRGELRQKSGRKVRNDDPSLLEVVKHHRDRTRKMIQYYMDFNTYVTALWKKRGIEFDV